MRCQERSVLPTGPMNDPAQADEWRIEPDGTRTCSFCGSLHEDDFIDIVERYLNAEPGYHFGGTNKTYKFYANRPNVANASEGGIKFYIWHVDRDDPIALANRAELVARATRKEHLELAVRSHTA